jgi:hypothetical protein
MTVAELIKQLQALPADLEVCLGDESNGVFHFEFGNIFESVEGMEGVGVQGEEDPTGCVIIGYNP